MKISVIIPAYNEEKYIGQCIASVLKYKTADLLEIIVVDNASTDRTAEVAAQYPMVRVAKEPQKGLTYARQKGLREAKGEILAFIDADNRVPENWFEVISREFLSYPKLVCLSGPYKYFDLSHKHFSWGILAWFHVSLLASWIIKYTVIGGNFAVKKQALQQIGGFDTKIAFYGEDTDIARRLSKVGRVKFNPKFFIYSSARRLAEEGIMLTAFRYAANYVSEIFLHKPFTKRYKDIR